MVVLRGFGVGQAVLPPQPRPSLSTLRALGFRGSDEEILQRASTAEPLLVRKVSSASSMWAANAATVAPGTDTNDARVHVVPANLSAMLHRSIETSSTYAVLGEIFADASHFAVHAPLPAGEAWSDEGAANHTRLEADGKHAHLFAWGRRAWDPSEPGPKRFPARQTFEASHAVARLLDVSAEHCVFARQHPDGIDHGAFHTDVLAVGHGSLFLVHEFAFADPDAVVRDLHARLGEGLAIVAASDGELPIADAVTAYPFNSQIVTTTDGKRMIVAPKESEATPRARAFLESVRERGHVDRVIYLDVRQSMRNGGGPACLRLRVPLRPGDIDALGGRVLFTPELEADLRRIVTSRYRDRLVARDLDDPAFHREAFVALDELTTALGVGAVYDFQR